MLQVDINMAMTVSKLSWQLFQLHVVPILRTPAFVQVSEPLILKKESQRKQLSPKAGTISSKYMWAGKRNYNRNTTNTKLILRIA